MIFQIYGTFLLTLFSFVLPILAIALSLFPEGVKALTDSYENKRKQAEENLEREFKKENTAGVDTEA